MQHFRDLDLRRVPFPAAMMATAIRGACTDDDAEEDVDFRD